MSTSLVYNSPNKEQWALTSKEDPLTFCKEVIHVGDFTLKDLEGNRFQDTVDVKDLEHWSETFALMNAAGVGVPLPLNHSFSPEQNRGQVVDLAVKKNAEGLDALFATVKFRDEEAAKLALTSDVSLYVPAKPVVDGKGNTYVRPIQHLALTDYPCIPALEKFNAIAASITREDDRDMALSDIAKKIGLKLEEGADDAAIEKGVVALFKELKSTIKASKQTPRTISAGLLSMARKNRKNDIDALVRTGKVTPAVAKDLEKQFCKDSALSLSLQDEPIDDGFEGVVAALVKNEPVVSFKDKSGLQADLQDGNNPKKSGLVLSAEQIAKAANK